MTKKDLKNGMIVETREGKRYLYCDRIMRGLDGWNIISNYTDNLNNTQFRNLDIVKVYEDTRKYSLDLIFKYEYLKLIWETPKLSEREIEILKALDTLGFTHIARDKGGNIFAYQPKPIKDSEVWFFNNTAHPDEIECEVELKKSIIKLEDLIETFDNYILQLNTRIKVNKEIIEENFDLNPSLCHDLEVENTALEFALMLLEGEIR